MGNRPSRRFLKLDIKMERATGFRWRLTRCRLPMFNSQQRRNIRRAVSRAVDLEEILYYGDFRCLRVPRKEP